MRSISSKHAWIVAAATSLLLAVPSAAQRTDEGYAPADTTFYEIMLSDEGVVAVDTAGYDWYYDFDRGRWEAGIPEPDEVPPPQDDFGIGGQDPIAERCTVEKWIKPFETRPVMVGYDEYVDGDITVLGRVTIKGWVIGNVRSLDKRVLITETGWVDGDIQAPKVIVREGGFVGGDILEEDFDLSSPFSVAGIIVAASFTGLLLLSALLVITVAPRHTENLCNCIENSKAKTFFLGFLLWLVMPLLMVLVTITIVGAFVIWVVPLAYVAASILGMIAFGNMVGRVLSRQLLAGEKGRLFQTLVGILLTMSLWFVSATLLG
ncbi:MAG: polymer-forming cytoskeletal protein, partial [candidate division Zixibacteria bacterium]|nr:polymer-forming cytoskeletal protein [candidate division Zixibacteria bacterium]